MTSQTYQDLLVWQNSKQMVVDVYTSCSRLRDYGFKDQIQRAAVSVMNNVAEGYARRSDKAFKNFLFIAKGSVIETESMIILAKELGYFDAKLAQALTAQTSIIARQLTAFINKL